MLFQTCLLAAGTAHLVKGHTAFTNFFVAGVNQGDGTAVRMSNNLSKATFPLPDILSSGMACGVNGEVGVSRVAATKAGDAITFEWRDWPDGSQPGSIDISHKGPCAVYMKKVRDATASNNAAGSGWFKIMEDGYDQTTGKWCTEKLIPNDGHLQATIPRDLSPGYYLMRPELLALHEADKIPPDPQFYVGCAQVFVTSTGNSVPSQVVSIPGYVNMSTPAMTFNIWQTPMKLPFPDFGPPLYTSSVSKRDTQAISTKQTIGLRPEGCVMTSANWCAYMPPSYNDEASCYSASKNCSSQTACCYNEAGPTGSKNCHNWEKYCTLIRNRCEAGDYHGLPSVASFMPPPLSSLDAKMVVSATGPMYDSVSTSFVSESLINPASSTAQEPAATVAVTAGLSTDTCGTNGGQTCQTGMCCSAHGIAIVALLATTVDWAVSPALVTAPRDPISGDRTIVTLMLFARTVRFWPID